MTTPCLAHWKGPTVNLVTPEGQPAGVLPTGAEVRLVYPGMISPASTIPMLFAVPEDQVEPVVQPAPEPQITVAFIEKLLDDQATIDQIAQILTAKPALMQRIIAVAMAQNG
jgi:hypothetical protein